MNFSCNILCFFFLKLLILIYQFLRYCDIHVMHISILLLLFFNIHSCNHLLRADFAYLILRFYSNTAFLRVRTVKENQRKREVLRTVRESQENLSRVWKNICFPD